MENEGKNESENTETTKDRGKLCYRMETGPDDNGYLVEKFDPETGITPERIKELKMFLEFQIIALECEWGSESDQLAGNVAKAKTIKPGEAPCFYDLPEQEPDKTN